MAGIRIGISDFPSITEALLAATLGDLILIDPGKYTAPLLIAASQWTTLKGLGANGQVILLNTPILERSGQGKLALGFTIQDLTFEYTNQSGYLFSPSIGSVPYNPNNPTLTSFRLKNVAFIGTHLGNRGVSGTYMDLSGAKNTIFDGIRVSLSGQAGFDPSKGTGGGFFVFHEGGADIQILNSEFNEQGYSAAFIILYIADALIESNRFIGGGLIRQDDGSDPADNPRGERFVNAGGKFANNHLSNGAFFDFLLQINSDTGAVWTDYKNKYPTADGTFGLRTNIASNTFDILPSGYGVLIRADVSPEVVGKMLSITGNVFNNGLAIRSDLASPFDLAFGQNYVNGILFDSLRVGGNGSDQLNANQANGRNWISGGLGNDQLHSSPGRFDAFVFYTPPNSQNNSDTIFGFETAGTESDQIWLDGETFRGLLSNGAQLDTRSFTANANGIASGTNGQIIFNTSTGDLFYDPDGVDYQNAVRFAILSGKESITVKDFRLFNVPASSPFTAPAVISLGVSPANVAEDGSNNLIYTFARTGPITDLLTVNYTISGSADSSDYSNATPGSGKSISFAAGSSTAMLAIAPKADLSVEGNETVIVTLNPNFGYSIGTSSAVIGLISNDDFSNNLPDGVPPSVSLAIAETSVMEDGQAALRYFFSRSGDITSALAVNYTVGGTATLGIDYTGIAATPATKTVTFAAGSSTAIVTVAPSTDAEIETDETVDLTLAAGTGYIIGTTAAVMGTILNDDTAIETQGDFKLLRRGDGTAFVETVVTGVTTRQQINSPWGTNVGSDSSEWLMFAAENIAGTNQILWRNNTHKFLHLWNLDTNWNWQSSGGADPFNSPRAWELEVSFDVDANKDGITGAPFFTTLEAKGNTSLLRLGDGTAFVEAAGARQQINSPWGTNVGSDSSEWLMVAAENIAGTNQILWRNNTYNVLHLWNLDTNWNWQSSSGADPFNTPRAWELETSFQVDATKDGITGAPPTPASLQYDWSTAAPLGGLPALLKASLNLSSPRPSEPTLSVTALRVDLRAPGISLTSTGRTSGWTNNTIETTTQTTRQFISSARSNGQPVVAAINAAPFDLDPAKQFQSVPTNIRGFAVSEGQLVSSTDYNGDTFKSTFLYDRITGARIENLASTLPSGTTGSLANQAYAAPPSDVSLASTLKVATSGFRIVLNNGLVPVNTNADLQNARSGLGLSADGRYLTMVAVDRQPNASQGATDFDMGQILRGFGAANGMLLDGGGSTQLAWWNGSLAQAELLSNPLFERYVGSSLGVTYQPLVV
jgi:hypothetical protein